MPSICLYFQVHQPHRLRQLNYFDKAPIDTYWDEDLNRQILEKVAEKCYLPTNTLLLKLIKRYAGRFKVSFSISGTVIEQFKQHYPIVLDSFKALVDTNCVELMNETYHHSLSAVFSKEAFIQEVKLHHELIIKEFDYSATTFRNTELIYNNDVAEVIAELGYNTILAEGADKILKHRSPNYIYQAITNRKVTLLLKNYSLSDDIAFRFSDRKWSEYPLTADKFSFWIHQAEAHADIINLFMDYETFGEHQWQSSGIFEFLEHFPKQILEKTGFDFCLPRHANTLYSSHGTLDIPEFYSWADTERDLSAWMGNALQKDALQSIYGLEKMVKQSGDETLLSIWRTLLTSDHFYYMCTKQDLDGDVHKYFSPYDNPYVAYVNYQNIIREFKLCLLQVVKDIPCAHEFSAL